MMCFQFWPSESIYSTEYGHFNVTCVGTMPKSDWEMTTLQVVEKNRVRMSVCMSEMIEHVICNHFAMHVLCLHCCT